MEWIQFGVDWNGATQHQTRAPCGVGQNYEWACISFLTHCAVQSGAVINQNELDSTFSLSPFVLLCVCADVVVGVVPVHRLFATQATTHRFPGLGLTHTTSAHEQSSNGYFIPSPTASSPHFSPSSSADTHTSLSPSSSPSSCGHGPVHVVPQAVTDQLIERLTRREAQLERSLKQQEERREGVGGAAAGGGGIGSRQIHSDQTLHLLLLSVLESVTTQQGPCIMSQVISGLALLRGLSSLFEEAVLLWLQLHNKAAESLPAPSTLDWAEMEGGGVGLMPGADGGRSVWTAGGDSSDSASTSCYWVVVHVARSALRLWLLLSSQLLKSSLTPSQAVEIRPLLSSPQGTISRACYSLREVGVFRGSSARDHEFTLMILETFLCCLHAANLLAEVSTSPVGEVFQVLRDILTDSYQEWLAYLCSKLHAVREAESRELEASGWEQLMDYCYSLLCSILSELITTTDHIKFFQKAAKSALSGEVLSRPITYSLEVATGFDKLTQRMSKLANIVLDCFKQVTSLQLLSLHLLSETAWDTVEIISHFLANILDPAVHSTVEVLDLYLELLESVWFRLSPDYTGQTAWWRKLSNYFILLQEAERGTVHQVLYHLQCLLGHDSLTLKSRLTEHVVLPFHSYLIARIREKVYRNQTVSGEATLQLRRASINWATDLEDALDCDEKSLVVLFLKLLLKVVSHPSTLQPLLANTSHLYSLFLLLPVPSFCPPTLAVAEECLRTLHKQSQEASEWDTGGTQRTLLKIFLKLGFSMPVDRITDLCLTIANGKILLPTFGIGDVDRVHKRLQDTFEHPPLVELLLPAFLGHMAIIANVWEILARLAPHGQLVRSLLLENNVWDVVEGFLPILGSLLSRIQQQIESGDLEAGDKCVCSLQELSVTLLSHLTSMAHFLCWHRKNSQVPYVYNYVY